jgi:RNA polymerase sigma-70 factor (ECF subfamily)
MPEDHGLTDRLRPVLAAICLVYNAGVSNPADEELRPEAIRLARTLTALMPDEAEPAALLALLLLTDARHATRTDADGALVVLAAQDRSRWDRYAIREGHAIVRRCLHRGAPGPYQIRAAINAIHTDARSTEDTDWAQIVVLYDQLLAVAPTPVVALDRAIAMGEVHGPAAALALVDDEFVDYLPYHATRADILHRFGSTPKPAPSTTEPPTAHRQQPNATSSEPEDATEGDEVQQERTVTPPVPAA